MSPRCPSQESPSRPCSFRSSFAVFSSSFNHRRQLFVEVSFSNSIYPVLLQHMWLLCLRRHVVGRTFPQFRSGVTSPAAFLSKSKSLPCRSTPCSINRDYSTDSVLTLLLQIHDSSYSVLFPSWSSSLGIPAPHQFTAADAFSIPGRLFLAFLAHRHLTAANALSIPVLRLGRLCLAFSTCSSTVSLSMHSRIRPSSKLRIPLAHLGNFFLLFAVVNALSYYRRLSF